MPDTGASRKRQIAGRGISGRFGDSLRRGRVALPQRLPQSPITLECCLCNTRSKNNRLAAFPAVPLLRVRRPSVLVTLRWRGASDCSAACRRPALFADQLIWPYHGCALSGLHDGSECGRWTGLAESQLRQVSRTHWINPAFFPDCSSLVRKYYIS
jgi:hypothetical protein